MMPEAVLTEARSLVANGDAQQAIPMLRDAAARYPQRGDLALLLADALHHAGAVREAVSAYELALPLNPTSAEAWYAAGCAHLALKSHGSAARHLARAAELAPASGAIRYNLATALFGLGHVAQAVASFELAERLDPEVSELARASVARIIPGSPQANHAAVLRQRRRWALGTGAASAVRPRSVPVTGRKLRVGYLSAFFGSANWMKPVFGLINGHDRSAFEIYLLSDGEPPSEVSGYRDHDLDVVCDMRAVTNDRVAEIIAELGVDILVDLNGYSFQQRLEVLMRRPAPHIVGWFNMFATTGLDAVDWLVGDAAVIRSEEERFYTERIHRVTGTYLAFDVVYPVPEVVAPPCLLAEHITFGCFGSHYKLTDDVLAAWAAILRGAPQARLFVKNGALGDRSVRDDLAERLLDQGVDAERVTMSGRDAHFGFLQAYGRIDIALDTFPYNGGTTTMEALWQGVPVLTFDGDRWASRTSKSLLLAAGLTDWVMPDLASYIDRAIELANSAGTPGMLMHMRQGMRGRLNASAACDTRQLCQDMELFYRRLCGFPGR